MATTTRSDEPREFVDADLRGARFVRAEYETDGHDLSVFATGTPSYAEVLDVRSDRVAMVRDFLATVTAGEPAATRRHPGDADHQETARSCLHEPGADGPHPSR